MRYPAKQLRSGNGLRGVQAEHAIRQQLGGEDHGDERQPRASPGGHHQDRSSRRQSDEEQGHVEESRPVDQRQEQPHGHARRHHRDPPAPSGGLGPGGQTEGGQHRQGEDQ